MGENRAGDVIAKIANWFAFICSWLCFLVFGFRVIGSSAKLHWCSNFISDPCNRESWRYQVFSFAPSTFVDVWTPFVFGFVGVFLHLRNDTFKIKIFLKDWVYFFVFHLCMSLFGMLGYANGIGIITGSICLVGNLFQFLAIFLSKDHPPGLDLEMKCDMKARRSNEGGNTFATVVSWIAFIAACLVLIVGIFRIVASEAHLRWCSRGGLGKICGNDDLHRPACGKNHNYFFNDDCNKGRWRYRLFSFVPDVFVDVWTPMIMGLVGMFFHFKRSPLQVAFLCRNWMRFFLYNLVMMLFGSLGYVSGFGIIVGILVAVVAMLSLIAFFICEKPPPLELEFNCKWGISGSGAKGGGQAST